MTVGQTTIDGVAVGSEPLTTATNKSSFNIEVTVKNTMQLVRKLFKLFTGSIHSRWN